MQKLITRRNLLLLSLCFLAAVVGCSKGEKEATMEDKGRVKLAYVEWSSEVASTNVMRVVLENQGYDVTITPVSAAAMWQSVASGDADGMVAAWLPTTHGH